MNFPRTQRSNSVDLNTFLNEIKVSFKQFLPKFAVLVLNAFVKAEFAR